MPSRDGRQCQIFVLTLPVSSPSSSCPSRECPDTQIQEKHQNQQDFLTGNCFFSTKPMLHVQSVSLPQDECLALTKATILPVQTSLCFCFFNSSCEYLSVNWATILKGVVLLYCGALRCNPAKNMVSNNNTKGPFSLFLSPSFSPHGSKALKYKRGHVGKADRSIPYRIFSDIPHR